MKRRTILRMVAGLAVGCGVVQSMGAPQGVPRPPPDVLPASDPSLQVSVDRLDGVYLPGETMVFTLQATNCPTGTLFDYELTFDSRQTNITVKTGKLQVGETVTIIAEQPGFATLTVHNKNLTAVAAAGVSPLAIQPSSSRPVDFKAYWEGKLAMLAAVPPNVRLKALVQPTEADYKEWNSKWPVFGDYPVRFKDIDLYELEADAIGAPARGYLAMPHGAAPGSLPAVLFTHGAGIGDADKLKPCAAARLGFLALDINAHGLLVGQLPDYYKKVSDEVSQKYVSFYQKGRLDKEELYMSEMYLRHKRSLDVLRSRPEWDGKNLFVRGASQGGCLALACAGLDTNVTAICAGVPACCDNTGENTLQRFFVNRNEDAATLEKIREAVRYVAVANFGPEAKAEAYFTVGFLDTSCHPAGVYAAYNTYAGPKRIYNGPVSNHGTIPQSIHYDDFTRFMLEKAAAKR